jgi:hypothetical protein
MTDTLRTRLHILLDTLADDDGIVTASNRHLLELLSKKKVDRPASEVNRCLRELEEEGALVRRHDPVTGARVIQLG